MRLSLPLLATLLFAAPPVFAQEKAEDPVIAEVNGVAIRESDLDAAYAELPEQYRQLPKEALLVPLRERLIDDELLRAEAERRKLDQDERVAREIARARARVMRAALLEQVIEEASTDERLRAVYEEMKAQPDFAVEEARISHILLDSEADARAVIEELDAGADFAALAKERSTGPSGPQGGDLGYLRKEALVPEFAEVAFALEPGTYTKDPVQTRFGWHVIRLEDKRRTVPSFEEVENRIREQVAREAITAYLDEARAKAEIVRDESFAPAPPASEPGGN
ncbi:MAG TPA: peptidylprolyl isomerase [Rhodospirillales bacterium]|nr:peptidylprolyl isomerase [Rhodospirillales bacterium]